MGALLCGIGDGLRIRRIERHPVRVQQLVHHKAERVDVHIAGIGLARKDLRCHVVQCAHTGVGCGGGVCDPRYTEITQFEVVRCGKKDVSGLDVPVDDPVPLAQLQCMAQVDAQPDHFLAGEDMVVFQQLCDGGEQFHPDQNIPAHAILVLDDIVVFIADDVAVPLELAHQSDLAVQLFYTVQKIDRCAFGVHAFGQSTFQTAVVGRNGDHLECAGKHGTKSVAPLDLKDFAVAALADELADVPSTEKWFVPLVVFRFHI